MTGNLIYVKIFLWSLTIILSQFGMARPGKTPKQTNFLVKNNIKLKHFVFSNEIVAGEHINSFGVLVFYIFPSLQSRTLLVP
jgi:hypothetical protein